MSKILKLAALLLCLPLLQPAWGQTASLVADLGQTATTESHSYPGPFVSVGGKVLFPAEEASSGREMWVSDGTAAGTELLVDACPGECPANVEVLGSGGGGVFWLGQVSSSHFPLLWWSDGTRAGTRALREGMLRVQQRPSDGGSFAFAGGVLYFVGCSGNRCDLWRSDGTEEGTRPVVSAPPWESGSISGVQAVGSTVFFLASERAFDDFGLWKTDGTEAGTRLVKALEVYPRLTGATPDRFFFVSGIRTGAGEELWASDGTEEGTRVIASFPRDHSISWWLKTVGRRVYFVADDVVHGEEIWRTDGTPQGTVRVTDFGYHDPFQPGLSPWQLEEVGGRAVFFATNGLEDVKLWTAAGTRESMVALARICESSCGHLDSNWRLAQVGGRVVFRGFDAGHGSEIWSTDGTATGTRRLTDACPGACGSVSAGPAVSGSAAWFALAARQGDPRLELWRSDGTPRGTRRFTRLETTWFIDDLQLAAAGSKIFFSAADEYGWEPWVSDGTPEGTGLVEDIARDDPGSAPWDLTSAGEALFFNACPGPFASEGAIFRSGGTAETTAAVFESGSFERCHFFEPARTLVPAAGKVFFIEEGQLWATDGTAGGAVQILQADDEIDQYLGGALVEHQGRLYFPFANQGVTELWSSDGTPAGTAKVLEFPQEVGWISHLASLGSELYFTAVNPSIELNPWRTDGTAAGTRRLTDADIAFSQDQDPQFVRLGANVFFAGDNLWKTNGTPEGTTKLRDLDGVLLDDEITDFTVFGGALYFFAKSPGGKRALWRSDGTETGTVILKEFLLDDFHNPEPGHLTIFLGKLFFAADDGVHGRELWTSDGTAAGTTLVRDILPGPESSHPSHLAVAGGRLLFAADDGLTGRELWESDGTAAGTRLRQDISPGGTSSSPRELTVAGGRLFFSANDGGSGRELWAIPLGGAPGCQPSPTVLCLAGGRFRVEAVWRDFENRTGAGQAVALTADTGYFWFFGPENVEVVVKVLDGVGVNGHHWVFYGALSNIEYSITVTDTTTGASRRYFNPTGRLGSVGDTEAFGPRGAFSRLAANQEAPPPAVTGTSTKAGPCVESATRLCLNGGRFAVEASWKDFSGNSGTGQAVRLTGDTGYFWFFHAANVELVLKVLDGRPANGKFWVFYGALSSVEYTVTVTDTATGKSKTYRNPSGRLASVADTAAF
jgi:ELWxxDGT repeat protein